MRQRTDDLRDDELLITRVFEAPVAVVWRLWSEPEHWFRWSGPQGFTVTDLDHDFRVGGQWRTGMKSAAYGRSVSHGQFLEIVPHERIVMSFAWEEGSGETTQTTITITFEEEDGRTVQHFHQTPFSSRDYRDSHVMGWNSQFNKEAEYAEALARGVQLAQLS
ncbi:SRPBCC family protein [Devosia nitrariae]|uniref:Activator of HSP90 ATPase n=1 Tax=Devosia nitrariae TaxID=2071872 RepID=A0ABQ5VZ17_9HYPH|nr:SRPBCC domain-containing protein [Devosia nitrariae]GLQ52796.1 activator of HSP90 ATPase [Devosia nitrariae]